MLRVTRSRFQRYSIALLAVVLALLPMLLLEPLMPMQCSSLMLGFAAVIVSAWYGGLGPGLLAIALVIPAVDYFFISPIHSLVSIDRADGLQLVVFSFVSLLSISLNAAPKAAALSASERLSKLCASEAKFRRLFDSNMIGVLFSDLEGNITEANDAFLQMVGYTQADLKAGEVRWDKMTPSEYRHLDDQAISELKEGGVSAPWEKAYIRSDGNRVSVVLACALLEGSQKNCVSFVLNLTERQRTEQELRELHQHLQDLTDRKQMETALRQSEQQLRAIVDNVPLGLYTSGSQGCEFVNQYWLSRMGFTLEQALGKGWMQAVHPEDLEWVMQEANAAKNASRSFEAEFRYVDREGNLSWVLDRMVPIRDQAEQVQFYQGFLVDITERKQAEEELRLAHNKLEMRVRERTAQLAKINQELLNENAERKRAEEAVRQSEMRYRTLIEQAADSIFIIDLWGNYLDVNPSCCLMSGYSREEILDRRLIDMIPSEDIPTVLQVLSSLQAGKTTVNEWRLKRKDGVFISVEVSAKMLPNGQFQGIMRDITQRKQAEYELRHNAFHDPLTSLPNRALLIDRLEHAIQQTKRHKDFLFAVLFLDLDRFKVINDSLGHLIGDQLLLAIAGRLKACLRHTDTAARLGGDEFTILLEGINDVSDALRVADRIQRELVLPFYLDGQEVFTSASIGIALSETGYSRPQDLLRDADTAMYRAKALGKARYEIFNSDMHAQAVARLQLEVDLRNAIERQEFCLQYQPIVSLFTGRIVSFEALVRWQHPQHGLRSPAEFIPVAEETGLINRINQWVLRVACVQLHTWQLQFPATPCVTMSVNLSGQQFTQPDLIDQVEQILQETGLVGSSLTLEVTEGGIMENAASVTTTLGQLRELGVQLSIDDFGTGYSSLGRLHHFPINELKIDRSFIAQMSVEQGNLEIIDTIVTLAHKLGLEVIAEGVETQAQLALLKELKCEYGQGYFFSQPLDSKAAEALLVANPYW